MSEDKINEIASDVKNFISNQSEKTTQINQLEDKLNKMQNYIYRSETIDKGNDFHDNEEKKAMNNYIRKGDYNDLVTKSFSSGADEGGVMITPELSRQIIGLVEEKSVMRKIASVERISTRSLDIIYEDGDFAAGWVAEGANRNVTDTPQLKKKTIEAHELYAQPKATQTLINDAEINVDSWIAERIASQFVRLENEAFITGDGNNKPSGILANNDIAKIDVANKMESDLLLALMENLNEAYLANASFLMNRKTLSAVQNLKDGNGRFIWNQSMHDPLHQTIFGVPVVISQHMPDIGTDNLAIALGDFKAGYKIVDRHDIRLVRDPFTDKPFVKFYAVKRVGGAVLNPDAIKFAKFA